MVSSSSRAGAAAAAAVLSLVLSQLGAPPAAACTEPSGPLDVEARLLEVVPIDGAAELAGTARIELTARAAAPLQRIALTVARPDGAAWPGLGAGLPAPRWVVGSVAGGDLQGVDGELALPGRGSARTVIEVPVRGRAVHEVVVSLEAAGERGPVRSEIAVRVPLGAALTEPDDDGEVAEFRAVPSREGR